MVWTKLAEWSVKRLAEGEGRVHVQLMGRYITVLLHKEKLYALDSPCFHASGPLGDGPIKDIEDIPCISCPWHNMLVALDTGEEVRREIKTPDFGPDGVYRPPSQLPDRPTNPGEPWPESWLGPPQRTKVVQRMHAVEERDGELWVDVFTPSEGEKLLMSDRPSFDTHRGKLCMSIQRDRLEAAGAGGGAEPQS